MDYSTEDGSANAGSDYEYNEGTLVFKPGETRKEIKVSEEKETGEIWEKQGNILGGTLSTEKTWSQITAHYWIIDKYDFAFTDDEGALYICFSKYIEK